MIHPLPLQVVSQIAQTYRRLCDAWWEDQEDRSSFDPPTIEVRLAIALYAMSHHRDNLPRGFEDWLENRIANLVEEQGEEVADLLLATFTDETLHQTPFLSKGGSC